MSNIHFPLPLKGKFVGKGQWELTAPFEYHSDIGGLIEIPIGFVSDGASIPKFLHSVIGSPWGGRYPEAAVVHDFCYFSKILTRQSADQVFLEAMKNLNVPKIRRTLMFLAVRIFGIIPWNRKRPFIGGHTPMAALV